MGRGNPRGHVVDYVGLRLCDGSGQSTVDRVARRVSADLRERVRSSTSGGMVVLMTLEATNRIESYPSEGEGCPPRPAVGDVSQGARRGGAESAAWTAGRAETVIHAASRQGDRVCESPSRAHLAAPEPTKRPAFVTRRNRPTIVSTRPTRSPGAHCPGPCPPASFARTLRGVGGGIEEYPRATRPPAAETRRHNSRRHSEC